MNTIKQDILVLEEMLKEWKEAKQSRLNAEDYGEEITKDIARDDRYIQALTTTIEALKALEEAGAEAPKLRVGEPTYLYRRRTITVVAGLKGIANEEFVRLTEEIARLKKRITRLKAELKWWHDLIHKHHNNETCPDLKTYVENLQKENEELRKEIPLNSEEKEMLKAIIEGKQARIDQLQKEVIASAGLKKDMSGQISQLQARLALMEKRAGVEEIHKILYQLRYASGMETAQAISKSILEGKK